MTWANEIIVARAGYKCTVRSSLATARQVEGVADGDYALAKGQDGTVLEGWVYKQGVMRLYVRVLVGACGDTLVGGCAGSFGRRCQASVRTRRALASCLPTSAMVLLPLHGDQPGA